MAISYSKVNWDTSKYVNPTNMNQMDNGIKAACDGVDELDSTKLNLADSVSITLPSGYKPAYQQNKVKLLGSGIAAISFSIMKTGGGVLAVDTLGTIATGHSYVGILNASIFDKNNSWVSAPIFINGNSITLLSLSTSDAVYIAASGIISYT